MTPRFSRRQVISLAGASAAGVFLAACSGNKEAAPTATPANGVAPATPRGEGAPTTGWLQPRELTSQNGVLEATLTIAAAMVPFGSSTRWALTVNGTTPGPTLRVRPGDKLRLSIDNQTLHATNLHTHGLHVSPSRNADNPFLEIPAGQIFEYEIDIPPDHRGGLHWYHPHLHHHVAEQLFAGFFGAIIVEDSFDAQPEVEAMQERLLILHDARVGATEASVTGASMMDMMMGREGSTLLVNGYRNPDLAARAGSLERWRILNASTSRFYQLALEGHTFSLIGGDGGRLSQAEPTQQLSLVPGERAEVLVRPEAGGSFRLSTAAVNRGSIGQGMGGAITSSAADLLRMTVTGSGVATAGQPALPQPAAENREVTRRREVVFSMQGMNFLIDGRPFDPGRIDIRADLGTTEEWTVRNVSTMDHPFHIHVWPFQVIEQSKGVAPSGLKDVVNVPAGGWARLLIHFGDIPGKTVYHCHILDHEDMGMMGVIEVS